MIRRLLLFGASGDLSGRYLLPALATLGAERRLPGGFAVVGAANQQWSDDDFRRFATERLDRHARDLREPARSALVAWLRYRPVDLAEPRSVAEALRTLDGEPVAAYLALPPGLFPAAIGALGAAGLPPGSRIAVEKPFGDDRESARELNRLLAAVAGSEDAIFRVDHALGMPAIEHLLARKDVLAADEVAEVELLWEETLALEGRAGYFDRAGALKDVIQNHLLQVLCLFAMDPGGGRDLHDRKLDVLRAARVVGSRRARYGAGRIGDRAIPAYADEEGVDPARCTETFAELVLELETERWRRTRFVLRAGKALAATRRGVLVHFRDGRERWFGIADTGELPAYSRVLLDILEGGKALSVRADAAEEAWSVVAPALESWERGAVPLEEYPAGSTGPR